MQRGGQTELLSGADDARRKSRSRSSSSLSVLDVYQWVEIEVDLEIKESLYQGAAENSIEVACCCRGPAAKHYLMSKQKENPGWQKLITSLFSRYMQTFLLFCWQWFFNDHLSLFFLFVFENILILLQWSKS